MVNAGIDPGMLPSDAKCVRFTNLWAFFTVAVYAFYVITLIQTGEAVLITGAAAGLASNVVVIWLNSRKLYNAGRVVFTVIPNAFILVSSFYFPVSVYPQLYFAICLVATFLVFPRSEGRLLSITIGYILLNFLVAFQIAPLYPPIIVLSRVQMEMMSDSSLFGVLFSLIFFGWAFRWSIGLAEEEVLKESGEVDKLLLNILPEKIVHRLQYNPESVSSMFSEVTVLFTTISGFDRITRGLEPRDTVVLLNELFVVFDTLAEGHGIEKIKTTGESYMAVSGVPEPRKDNLEATAEMALDCMEAARSVAGPDGRPLQIKIGICTGPAVAGVIGGGKKFSYDVWGDTVNTASRMESTAPAGTIHVCESVHEKLAGRYIFTSRGAMDVRGKGLMKTWFLVGRAGSKSVTAAYPAAGKEGIV
ncbi:MAG: adenylate/guanylate cyclase domain-containing protein [Myxococcota bacterium]